MSATFFVVRPDLPANPFAEVPALRFLNVDWEAVARIAARYDLRVTNLVERQDLKLSSRWRRAADEAERLARAIRLLQERLRALPLPSDEADFRVILEARQHLALAGIALANYQRTARRGARGGR